MKLESMLNSLVKYLKQPGTWQGIAVIAGALGYTLAPGYQEAILAAAGLMLGVIQVMKDEDRERTPITKEEVIEQAKEMGLIVRERKTKK